MALPLGIIPLGTVLNTLVYAAAIWTIVILPRDVRLRRRLRRGQCVRCGYQLRDHGSCPECGCGS